MTTKELWYALRDDVQDCPIVKRHPTYRNTYIVDGRYEVMRHQFRDNPSEFMCYEYIEESGEFEDVDPELVWDMVINYLDYSLNLDSRNRFEVNLGDNQILVDMADFAGWLFQTSQVDDYQTENDGLIIVEADIDSFDQPQNLLMTKRGRFVYTFQSYLSEFGNTAEFDRNLESYLKTLKIKTNV